MAPYEYIPLDKEIAEIRLLTLLPGPFNAPIQITIQHCLLSKTEFPDFEALSYAWGDAADRLSILVHTTSAGQLGEGHSATLHITRNLHEALHHLRRPSQGRLLWIDAICIDQQNIEERGVQVQRMPDIYGSACAVIVWLGPESQDSTEAIKFLDNVGSQIEVNWKSLTCTAASTASIDPRTRAFVDSLDLSPHLSLSLQKLLDRPWFSRLWVAQEVALAKGKVDVICGLETLPFKNLRNAVFYLRRYPVLASDSADEAIKFEAAWYLLTQTTGVNVKLSWRLYDCRNLQCSDERDRVYAILSLCSDNARRAIPVDYTKSVPKVYEQAVLQELAQGSLNIFRFCCIEDTNIDLPTWVPNWSARVKHKSLPYAQADLFSRAHAESTANGVLTATGLCEAVVREVKKGLPQSIPNDEVGVARYFQELLSKTIGRDHNRSSLIELQSLCRTIWLNEFSEIFLPVREGFLGFRDAMKLITECSDISPEVIGRYMPLLKGNFSGKSFITTCDGRFALAPEATKPGDKICVILGCEIPLILRPDNRVGYAVVGDCYFDGIMSGEAVLGKLPSNWKIVLKYFPERGINYNVFLNGNTGESHIEDPRRGPLPDGWRTKNHEEAYAWDWYVNDDTGEDAGIFDPRLEPGALRARGVPLQEFRLI